MSAQRDALERAQARLRELETRAITDEQLSRLAEALHQEALAYEQVLERGELRVLKKETTALASRLMAFGFALLFVTPMVAMLGSALSKTLRYQPELATALVVLGLGLIGATLLRRARLAVAHLVSSEWRLIKRAHRKADALHWLIDSP